MPRLAACLLVVAALGCSSSAPAPAAPETTTAEAPAAALPANAQLVSFSVPGMTCAEGCAPIVKETLEDLPGVLQVNVDFETKTATCALEESQQLDSDAALAALAEAGFKDSALQQ